MSNFLNCWNINITTGPATLCRGADAGIRPFFKTCRQCETSAAGTHRTLCLDRDARHKTRLSLVVAGSSTRLRVQMYSGTPSPGHRQHLAINEPFMRQNILSAGREFGKFYPFKSLESGLN